VGKMTSLGWPESIARYVPRLDARQEREQLAGFLLRALASRFVLTAAVAVALVAGFGVIAPIFKLQGSERAFTLFAAAVIFTTQNFLLTAAIESLLLQRTLFVIGALTSLYQAAFIVTLYVRGGSLVALMWMELSGDALMFLLGVSVVFRAVGGGSWWHALRHQRPFADRTAVRYRRYSFLNDISQELLSPRSDYLMLSYLTSAVQVAIYAVPTRIIKFVEMLVPVALLKGPLESAFYRAYERDRTPARLNEMFQTLAKINLTVLGFILAVSLVYATTAFVRAFGVQYQDAGRIFSVFIIVMALYYYPIGFVLKALERMDLILWSKLSVLLYFALAVFLVRALGALGMALTTATALLVKNLVVYWMTRRIGRIRMPWGAIGRIAANVAVTAGLLLGVRAVAGAGWMGIAAGVVIGAAAYAGLTFFNSGYSTAELGLFADLLPSRIRASRLTQQVLDGMLQRAAMAPQAAGVGPR
ncbi:MAG TPA: polysaccharide biosynthesis C-terminal domain-containing protein, partial [bacterium]